MNRLHHLMPPLILAAATLVAGPAAAREPIPGADVAPSHADALPGALSDAELSTIDAGTSINTTRSNIKNGVTTIVSVNAGPQGTAVNTTRSNIKSGVTTVVSVNTGP